jgi:hypothetical protein
VLAHHRPDRTDDELDRVLGRGVPEHRLGRRLRAEPEGPVKSWYQ